MVITARKPLPRGLRAFFVCGGDEMALYAPKRARMHKKPLASGEVGKLPIYTSLKDLRKAHGNCNYWRVTLPKGAE